MERKYKGTVLSLFDKSGVFVDPWLDAGYRVCTVDNEHKESYYSEDGYVICLKEDINTWVRARS